MRPTTLTLFDQVEERLAAAIAARLRSPQKPALATLELVLTEACTLSCDYCFVASKEASRRMPWRVARAAVDFLLSHSGRRDEVEITFFGGEPLLEFPMMRRIAGYAEARAGALAKRVHYAVTTNGTLMTPEIALFGRQHGFNYLLSIDGDRKAHDCHRRTRCGGGSWDVVTGPNFDLLRSVQGWMGARITVSPDTVHRLVNGVRVLRERGVNQFLIAPDEDVPWADAEIAEWVTQWRGVAAFYAAERAKGDPPMRINELDTDSAEVCRRYAGVWGCGAGVSRMAVSCSGELWPCSRFVCPFPGMGRRFVLGTVFVGVTNIAAQCELSDQGPDGRERCCACDLRDACPGACPAVGLHMNGDIRTPVPLDCAMARLRTEGARPVPAHPGRTTPHPA